MKITEEKINEIREATDIVDVISQYVSLKRRGKSFFGLCPFHQEKTPSFHVDPIKGFYHCFGCGEGGNVFSFIMKMDKITFPDAVRHLAQKANIDLPIAEEDSNVLKETQLLYHVNQMAALFFRECLLKTEAGKKAGAYLTQRGFHADILESFLIGYAPNRWDGLIQKAKRESVSLDILHKAGLIIARKDGSGFYDRFRGRLMFPVINISGNVVGFGGRALKDEKGIPKYINSPETSIYRKSYILYGLYQSREGIRKEDKVLFVEGYTDLMRLHQAGIPYGVATSGTALTEGQANLISRYTKNVILVYDGDSAGFAAALRGADVLLSSGLHVQVAPLPRGTDPDVFLRENDPSSFNHLLNESKSIVEFQLAWPKQKLDTPAAKSNAANELLDTIRKVKDPVERQLMVRELAEKLGIEESLLHQKIRKLKQREKQTETEADIVSYTAREKAEKTLLRMILEFGEIWGNAVFSQIQPSEFQNEMLRKLAESLYSIIQQGFTLEPDTVLNRLLSHHDAYQCAVSLISLPLGRDIDLIQLGLDCILYLKEDKMKQSIQSIRKEMRIHQHDEHKMEALREKWISIRQERAEVKQDITESWKKVVEKL